MRIVMKPVRGPSPVGRRVGVEIIAGNTRNGVIARSARQTWASTERKKSRKRNWPPLTAVLDANVLEL